MSNLQVSPPDLNSDQNSDQLPTEFNPSPGQCYPPASSANLNYPPYPAPIPRTAPYNYRPDFYRPDRMGELVGFWPRAAALVIDSLIISIPSAILNGMLNLVIHPLWNDWWNWPVALYTFGWSTTIMFWGLYAWFCYTNLRGNTFGKVVLGIKLINLDGTKPSLQNFLLHFTVGYWINQGGLCVGYLWAIFATNKQTLGQKIFRGLTVRGKW